MKENVKINKKNIATMKIMKWQGNYRCVLCKAKVDTNDSYSNQGDILICNFCYNTKFKSEKQARQWMDREIEL